MFRPSDSLARYGNPKALFDDYLEDMDNVDGAAEVLGLKPTSDLNGDFS